MIGTVSNETNTYVRMYIEEIYSSRDLDTLELNIELKMHGKILVYIHSQQRIGYCENCS